jgi:uncharacterized membrane protein YtjA (UPF0391 family)
MLRVAAVSLALALVAALFSFGSVLGYSWEGARTLCFIFAVLSVLSFVVAAYRWRALLN